MTRRLAIRRKTDLSDAEGLDDSYVLWTPVTYAEAQALKTEDTTDEEAYGQIVGMVRSHFAGGKIRVINEDTYEDELVDMKAEDVDLLPSELITKVFIDMTGAQYVDPKDSKAPLTENPSSSTELSGKPQPTLESTTETSSSETPLKVSPAKSSKS